MSSPFVFDIGSLLKKPQGFKESRWFDGRYLDTANFIARSNVTGEILFMKLDTEIHVELADVKVKIEFQCNRCLKTFIAEVKIPFVEKEFFFERPEMIEDEQDLFLVDLERGTIDITELLRQEILLHFPMVPVCSSSCKGLCPSCGQDLNAKKCSCEPLAAINNNPFRNL